MVGSVYEDDGALGTSFRRGLRVLLVVPAVDFFFFPTTS